MHGLERVHLHDIRQPPDSGRFQRVEGLSQVLLMDNVSDLAEQLEPSGTGSFRGTNVNTFSISTALALMAFKRRALKSSSGVSVGSMLAAATSSVSAAHAAVFSWRAKG